VKKEQKKHCGVGLWWGFGTQQKVAHILRMKIMFDESFLDGITASF